MFWDKKNKHQGLPDLPHSPTHINLPERRLPEISDRTFKEPIQQLPSFPDSPMKQGFSQAAIKDAISTQEIEENNNSDIEIPPIRSRAHMEEDMEEVRGEKKYNLVEVDDWKPQSAPDSMPIRRIEELKPVYIKLEKFHAAKRTLEEVKQLLDESEKILGSIREIKRKEDEELAMWEKELQTTRARISNVTKDIFERVE